MELKVKLKNAYEEATPDVLEKIKESCRKLGQEEDIISFAGFEKAQRMDKVLRYLIAVAAMLIIGVTSFGLGKIVIPNKNIAVEKVVVEKIDEAVKESINESINEEQTGVFVPVAAVIYLDVNPSIKITVDENKKVVACEAKNEDAKKILRELSLNGVDVDVALKSIVGSLYINGYLKDDTAAMLVSIEAKDKDVVKDVESKVKVVVKDKDESIEVIVQEVDSKKYEELAKSNEISVGKMQLIENIVDNTDKYTKANIEELATLSIKDLCDIWEKIQNKPKDDKTPESKQDEKPEVKPESKPDSEPDKKQESKSEAKPKTDPVSSIVDTTTDAAFEIVDTTTDTAFDIVDTTVDAAFDIVDTTTDVAFDIVDTTTDAAFDVAETATDAAVDVVETTTETVTNVVEDVFKFILH